MQNNFFLEKINIYCLECDTVYNYYHCCECKLALSNKLFYDDHTSQHIISNTFHTTKYKCIKMNDFSTTFQ